MKLWIDAISYQTCNLRRLNNLRFMRLKVPNIGQHTIQPHTIDLLTRVVSLAVKAVIESHSQRAAEEFGIPRSTLGDHI